MSETFWLIGDSPYSSAASTALDGYLNNVPNDVEFVVHVGDIWRPKASPTLADYQRVAHQLLQSDKPVFIVPGDNEYDNTNNPTAALGNWRQTFVGLENNWQYDFTVSRQAVRPENFAFVSGEVLYLGIDMSGGRHLDQAAQRGADDLAWINENFAACKGEVTSCVIFAQASPLTPGYNFASGFVAAANDFGLPILWAQGDLHHWQEDHPFAEAPNVTRVVTAATGTGPDSAPLKITVTDTGEFAFDHGFPSNATAINGTSVDDILVGQSANQNLTGFAGNDHLDGGAGNDTLYGGSGNDWLYGGNGKGQDALFGGDGADIFIFKSAGDTKVGTLNRDHIGDFQQGVDTIDLSLIDAIKRQTGDQAFTFIGDALFDKHAGELNYSHVDLAGTTLTVIAGDTNGDGKADFEIELAGTFNPTPHDFIV